MSENERTQLGEQIRNARERIYGTKLAAYTAADVNAATWSKAEAGDPIRGDLLRKIVRTLWPESQGDWTRIGSVGGEGQAGDYVASPGDRAAITLTEEQLQGIIARAIEDARRISGNS